MRDGIATSRLTVAGSEILNSIDNNRFLSGRRLSECILDKRPIYETTQL